MVGEVVGADRHDDTAVAQVGLARGALCTWYGGMDAGSRWTGSPAGYPRALGIAYQRPQEQGRNNRPALEERGPSVEKLVKEHPYNQAPKSCHNAGLD